MHAEVSIIRGAIMSVWYTIFAMERNKMGSKLIIIALSGTFFYSNTICSHLTLATNYTYVNIYQCGVHANKK